MKKQRRQRFGRIAAIAALGVGVGLIVTATLTLMQPWNGWPPSATCATHECIEAREWIASGVTLIVLLAGLFQYRKTQLWKRAEFVATEMKAFFADPEVRKATIMIDWATRRINLLNSPNTMQESWPIVSRETQVYALLPHDLVRDVATSTDHERSEAISGGELTFNLYEAAIRDCYDRLFDGLERFANYIDIGLVSKYDLEPYLGYWVRDIASDGADESEWRWTCMLMVYINVYNFTGVQKLFKLYDKDIAYRSKRLEELLNAIKDQDLARSLREVLEKRRMNAR